MEAKIGRKFGDLTNPLFLSVRSGAAASMPGMMDTVLNLGINDGIVEAIIKSSGNPRWAYDTYRRFIQMFSDGESVADAQYEKTFYTTFVIPTTLPLFIYAKL